MTENMSCDEIDAVLSDYLEGTMEAALRQSAEAHISSCLRCSALVRDLAKITADAHMLPELVPSRDLWKGIDGRIAATVIPLGAGQTAPRTASRRVTPAWMGIAAAALMMSTAGVTYFLTARTLTPARVASGSVRPAPAGVSPAGVATIDGVAEGTTEPWIDESSDRRVGRSSLSPARTSGAGAEALPPVRTPVESRGPVAGFVSETSQVRDAQTDIVYGREIEMLQRIVRGRKEQLDSSTVTIIERNLKVIDAAIEQSRAALARDPASNSLSDQLTRVLDKKVELLRTAALLPAST
ncbi:MAG TPA: zf-HC2 domain-containing protein [Gemmatimonadaceae bacterium]|nr:zf-HC2 domain-containing protein [Gemmatimonadaceae bacterium]